MAFLACAAMGPLQSCKDDLSDLTHQVNHDKSQLAASLKALSDVVASNKEDCGKELEKVRKNLQDQLDPLNALDLPQVKADVEDLKTKITNYVTVSDLNDRLEALKDELKGMSDAEINDKISQEVANQLAGINQTLEELNTSMTNITGDVNTLKEWQTTINDWKESLKDIDFSQIDKNKTDIAAIKADMELKQAAIDEINASLRNLTGDLRNLEAQVYGHTEEIEGLRLELEELTTDFEELGTKIEELNAQIEEVYGAIEETNIFVSQAIRMLQNEIDEAFDALTNRVDNLITGIVLQGTDCPIFGNFSLPLGIKSNLLFNWYGYNDRSAFQFPNASSMHNYYDANPVLTEAELAALAPEYKNVAEGLLGDVNVGRLYMTINPAGHYFDSNAFSLETSAGKKFPATLDVSKSGHELYFGYTRGLVEGNGFYRADVVIPEDEIVNARLDIDEGLKAAAKDALKDPSKRSAYELLKAVYAQLNGKFPAYGVRYNWNVGEKNYSVLSGYDVAATTAKPLSYSFLYGKGTNKHLPTFGHINNILDGLIDKDKFKFELNTKFEINGFTITFTDLEFDFSGVDVDIDRKPIEVTIPKIDVMDADGNVIGTTSGEDVVPVDGMNDVYDAIEKGLKDAIAQLGEDLNGQINQQIRDNLIKGIQDEVNKMLDDIQQQITNMLSDLEGQINEQMSNIIDDLMSSIENKAGTLFNKVNDAIDLYNKVAGKINDVLKDPNHYLQVAMFYKGNGKVGVLSNNKKDPTPFRNAGGDAISLYASSYSAEILAPAYMKYIAVSNVYDKNGNEVAAEKANLKAINEASHLNKVYPGFTKRIGVSAKNLKPGLVYEIVYQGVDYSGRTSAQKFYITVNK